MADARLRWEQASKELRFTEQLANLSGQLTQLTATLPNQMETVARRVVIDVLADQAHQREEQGKTRWLRADQLSAVIQAIVAVLMVYLVVRR